ncbi:MAG: N-acetylmuramoyl-L-alanine amidase, partial [Candidatus Zixiibacteriota bacterium]
MKLFGNTIFSHNRLSGRRLAAVLALAFLTVSVAAQAEIDVSLSGRQERVGSFTHGEIHYFSLSEFVALYGEKLSWDILGQSVDYKIGENRFRFFLESPFLNLNDTVRNITYPVKLRDGALYLPVQTFVKFLDRTRPERVTWEADRKRIRVETGYYNVTDLTVSQKANGLLLEIYLSEELPFQLSESEGGWLNVSLPGGRVNRQVVESRRTEPAIRDINAFQFEGSAQISVRLRRTARSYDAKYHPESGRIQLSIRNPNFKPKATHRPVGQIGPDKTIDLIVIDPGHGGEDNGAIGRRFTKEKDMALAISRELAKQIRKEKLFKVMLTRDKDEFISLEERAGIANRAQADLFISIHMNANISRQARGAQVFFLAPAKNDEARALAQAENAS